MYNIRMHVILTSIFSVRNPARNSFRKKRNIQKQRCTNARGSKKYSLARKMWTSLHFRSEEQKNPTEILFYKCRRWYHQGRLSWLHHQGKLSACCTLPSTVYEEGQCAQFVFWGTETEIRCNWETLILTNVIFKCCSRSLKTNGTCVTSPPDVTFWSRSKLIVTLCLQPVCENVSRYSWTWECLREPVRLEFRTKANLTW